MTAPRVIYVLGTPRSGSTLLTRLLGDLPGTFSAGEIRLLWRELDRRTCGCGVLARDCHVWAPVIASNEIADLGELMHTASRMTVLPRILAAHTLDDLPDEFGRYARFLTAVYRRLHEVTGAEVIVDSSKSVAEAALLRLGDIDTSVAHIVRDPRAVVYSWERALREGAVGTPYHPTWSIALRWMLTNSASEAVCRRYGDRATRIRYEDLARDPSAHVEAVVEAAGGTPTGAPLDQAATRHIVGGNRLRRSDAPVTVRVDDEWRSAMPRPDAAEVAGLTYPLRRRYHYAGRSA
jgi:hypothetical protein